MSRYIDADAFEVFGYETQDGTFDDGVQYVLEKIDAQPTADVVLKDKYDRLLENATILANAVRKYQTADVRPIVRGEWLLNDRFGFKIYDCSNCGIHMEAEWNYCPNCGAEMDERREDECY